MGVHNIVDAATVLTMLSGVLLPWLVSLVTHTEMPSHVKELVLAALAVIASVVAQIIQARHSGIDVNYGNVIFGAIATWVTGHVTYQGVLKDLKITHKLQDTLVKPPMSDEDWADSIELTDGYSGDMHHLTGGKSYADEHGY